MVMTNITLTGDVHSSIQVCLCLGKPFIFNKLCHQLTLRSHCILHIRQRATAAKAQNGDKGSSDEDDDKKDGNKSDSSLEIIKTWKTRSRTLDPERGMSILFKMSWWWTGGGGWFFVCLFVLFCLFCTGP